MYLFKYIRLFQKLYTNTLEIILQRHSTEYIYNVFFVSYSKYLIQYKSINVIRIILTNFKINPLISTIIAIR